MKTWCVSYYREPVHEEAIIKAKTALEASKKLFEVLDDATVEHVYEVKEKK